MHRTWKVLFLFSLSIFFLSGCMASLEEKADDGINAAKETFYSDSKDQTDEIEGIKLYKPAGFTVNNSSVPQNIVLNRKNETFILFVNPNEKESSRLFYELLLADTSKEILAEESFEKEDSFGFAAVLKSGNEKSELVELVVSVGGTKMTTIGKKKFTEDLTQMMQIVQSIKQDKE
ncbi:hypothetical protein ACXYMX_10910 [Sporosarcina sp. CAU 1771]